MNQLVIPTLGLLPTYRGLLTTQLYIGATIFMDHFSDLIYVHLMIEMNVQTITNAKEAFGCLAHSYNVKFLHYHADNSLFDTAQSKTSIKDANQTLSFCGVNAHH